jgi:hypothetical protein
LTILKNSRLQLTSRWLQLARQKDLVRREEILDQLSESRQQMSNALESAQRGRCELRRDYFEGWSNWPVS